MHLSLKTHHEAWCIVDKIDYIFLCCVNVWYDILFQVNIASQALQSVTLDVQTAIVALENLLTYLQNFFDHYQNLITNVDQH